MTAASFLCMVSVVTSNKIMCAVYAIHYIGLCLFKLNPSKIDFVTYALPKK